MTKKNNTQAKEFLSRKGERTEILLRHVEGVELSYNDIYAIVANDGYEPGIQTFRKDIAELDMRHMFLDSRQFNKGAPPLESTRLLRPWLIEHMEIIYKSEGAVSVRRVYYVVLGIAETTFGPGVFGKSETNSNKVGEILGDLRRGRIVPYEWIVESGRAAELNTILEWNAADCIGLTLTDKIYNISRDPWQDTKDCCEIWYEKDTVSHIFQSAANAPGVPMVSCHGMPSITLRRDAAKRIEAQNKKGRHVTIYYYGDLDKSGLDIANTVRNDLESHADAKLDWSFIHKGIHPWQVEQHGLMTHPRKRRDTENPGFRWAPDGWDHDTVCELDAADPSLLRGWTEADIGNHLTEADIAKNKKIEAEWHEEATQVTQDIRLRCTDIRQNYNVDGD